MIRKQLQKNKIIIVAGMMLFCLPGLTGCKKEQPAATSAPKSAPVAQKPKPVQKQASSAAAPAPSAQKLFDPDNCKDPFKPFVVVKPAAPLMAERAKATQSSVAVVLPIHSFDVEKFTLIGIVTGGKQSQAMVVDPNKKGYVLKVGMNIGNKGGKVISITTTGVKIKQEKQPDEKEGTVVTLTLPKKQ